MVTHVCDNKRTVIASPFLCAVVSESRARSLNPTWLSRRLKSSTDLTAAETTEERVAAA